MLAFILKILLYIPYRLIFWTKWVNKKELKKFKGKPVILALNHRNAMDGPTLYINVGRKLNFWIKAELFNTKFRRFAWRNVGGVPVKAGADLSLIRNSKAVLSKKRALVIMPEGHRSFNTEDKLQIRNGIAMIGLQSGVPIIPIMTDRAIKPFRLTRFKVGEAILCSEFLQDGRSTKQGIEKIGEALKTSMENMLVKFEKKEKMKPWQVEQNIIARGITIKDNKLLAILRNKKGQTYYVLPGGHLEEGESSKTACEREVIEETGVTVRAYRELYKYWHNDPNGRGNGWQTFFVCEYQGGEPHKTDAEEYTQQDRSIYGTYEPVWLDMSQIKNLDIRPSAMKKRLIKDYRKKGARLSFPLRLLKVKK